MVFSTYDFVFIFMPVVVAVYYLLNLSQKPRTAIFWLTLCSLIFYGWWNPRYLVIILTSIVGNYLFGIALQKHPGRVLLAFGIAANLALLGSYKYATFIVENVNWTLGSSFFVGKVLLPIGISFFTFQQIAWLVDSSRGQVSDRDPLGYALFVSFFPQLIAGPIVHHSEVIPQYMRGQDRSRMVSDFAIGMSIFIVGLSKKVLIADRLAPFADFMFNNVAAGDTVGFVGAWAGVLAFSLQIYFDFSAYSDMAIGIAAMMGFRLPMNFNAPYKAADIREFWRRWHITLSRFLRDYLYIPLGGSKNGRPRQITNLMVTMLLGGLWHGAGWNFILWGGLHGLYLVIYQFWRYMIGRTGGLCRLPTSAGVLLTSFFVILAWVPFRAADLPVAIDIYQQLAGARGFGANAWMADPIIYGAPETMILGLMSGFGQSPLSSAVALQYFLICLGFLIVWFTPTTAQLFENWFKPLGERLASPTLFSPYRWQPDLARLAAIATLFFVCVIFMRRQAPFLYFQF